MMEKNFARQEWRKKKVSSVEAWWKEKGSSHQEKVKNKGCALSRTGRVK